MSDKSTEDIIHKVREKELEDEKRYSLHQEASSYIGIMKSSGYTQHELAELFSCPQPYISNWASRKLLISQQWRDVIHSVYLQFEAGQLKLPKKMHTLQLRAQRRAEVEAGKDLIARPKAEELHENPAVAATIYGQEQSEWIRSEILRLIKQHDQISGIMYAVGFFKMLGMTQKHMASFLNISDARMAQNVMQNRTASKTVLIRLHEIMHYCIADDMLSPGQQRVKQEVIRAIEADLQFTR